MQRDWPQPGIVGAQCWTGRIYSLFRPDIAIPKNSVDAIDVQGTASPSHETIDSADDSKDDDMGRAASIRDYRIKLLLRHKMVNGFCGIGRSRKDCRAEPLIRHRNRLTLLEHDARHYAYSHSRDGIFESVGIHDSIEAFGCNCDIHFGICSRRISDVFNTNSQRNADTRRILVSLHDLTKGGHVQKVGHGRGVRWQLLANVEELPLE